MSEPQTLHDPVEREFWEGTSRGELLVRWCLSCEKPHWQPRAICPHCGHAHTRFRRSPGTGEIYALTWLHAKGQPPQSLAYIRLDEGITLLSRLDGEGIRQAVMGDRVEVTFIADREDRKLPVFILSRSQTAAAAAST